MSIYNSEVALEDGTVYLLEKCAGKLIVIASTVIKYGSASQFEQLEELYQAHQSQGLVILGFPSNQFKQELVSATEAVEACKATHGVTFLMHQLISADGENTDPLFTYFRNEAPGTVTKVTKWNFTKFLTDRNGKATERFAPQASPSKMTTVIEPVL